jgi:hypothetical protein
LQVDASIVDFPDIVKVVDEVSALIAVDRITRQGEGTSLDRTDCHFGVFAAILAAYEQERRLVGDTFQPARRALSNPAAAPLGSYGAPDANLLTEETTLRVAKLFDSIYSLMLRMLGHAFTGSGDESARHMFSQTAFAAMTTVVKPLGEALMVLPAGPEYGGARGGPGFGLTRHVLLSNDTAVARLVAAERLKELSELLNRSGTAANAPHTLRNAAAALERISTAFGDC